ncbi:uncharacterized protein EV420DRAFT_1486390 [Desarmillaria tabescens]|uniref:Uncharacterized protein n=1 Tax=Armillaria tabescens TaxID=1929756 RepID=A0AA39MMF1_ARMTA|nr:uncharacterized protein EV420DRAFT_1486390 [Desarmillaria tabescens]KAK0439293.1 hypothetical protein EV420DRAFT_1486390 [Desarmillaria tabescens]
MMLLPLTAQAHDPRWQQVCCTEQRCVRDSSGDIVTVAIIGIQSSFPIQGVRTLKTTVKRAMIVKEVLRAEVFRSGERPSVLYIIRSGVIAWRSETSVYEAKNWRETRKMKNQRRGQKGAQQEASNLTTSYLARLTMTMARNAEPSLKTPSYTPDSDPVTGTR